MRYRELLKKAEQLGGQHGSAAIAWYWDRTDPKKADYQRVLKGINDGDPRILDTLLPSSPLSGEFADDMTPNRLYEELGVEEYQLRNWEESYQLDNLCTAYEQAFSDAAKDTLEQQCIEMLEETYTIVIHAKVQEITPDTLSRWVASVEDAAARNQNVSVDDVDCFNESDSVEAYRL